MSALYFSLIMHPANFPLWCGAHTNTCRNIVENGMDENTAANALGEFFCSDRVNALYIGGAPDSHGELFFRDLERCLRGEPELVFLPSAAAYEGTPGVKFVIRAVDEESELPTEAGTHRVLHFPRRGGGYRSFDRSDFCCFLYCGNTEEGPHDYFRCRNPAGRLCTRRRYGGGRTCGVCFWCPMKKRLERPTPHVSEEDEELLDEGCVAEPLGVPRDFYRSRFSDAESDPPETDEEPDSECDW
ncbi:hypothetical protein PAV19gp29 [Psittacine adenovirus 3]|uniref:Uncharacterized protein n=1 Tax=Psittacine adenovirus 3 TaxID=1580497 RepID=A0A0A7JW98_9ADEN|nr:hypothetical protein SC17_gp29 [Psittacine adenovirus 3]AIZ35790.1 hypothetical protein PAV19gp29 [Psittacine adenovirus 3]